MIYYIRSAKKEYRYIFVIIDTFSNYIWCIPLKNEKSQTITNDFSKNLTTSKRSPLKLESDRGKEWYNSIFRTSGKVKTYNIIEDSQINVLVLLRGSLELYVIF